MGQSVVSPVLIGRLKEMALLAAGLRRAQQGEPVVALIGGEAGVGKTRLVSELASLAVGANCTVLAGHCIELGAEGLPLAPLVDALRALSRETSAEELAEALGPALPHLARILPGLASGAAAWPAAGDVQTGQLLELVLGLLERLSAIRPLVLVLEDLHWADQSTLELVTFLIRSLREVRLLLVITYRSDELHRRHPLRSLLAGWARVRMVDRIELDRFRRDEVAAQTLALQPEAVFVANLLLLRAERGAMSGRYGDSEADLGSARQALGGTHEAQFVQHISYIAALLAIGREDRAVARPIIDECLPQTLTGAARHAWPLLWLGTRIEADEAVLARDRGEPVSSQSRERGEVLAGWAAELVTAAVPAHGYRALFAAERARALGGDEPPHWMAAIAAFETAGEPYPLAYAWLRLAEVYAMAGQRSAAARAAMQAQVTAGRIGADPIASEVAALARRARLIPDGLPGGDATAAEAPVDGLARFGLTSREREVLGVLGLPRYRSAATSPSRTVYCSSANGR